MCSLVSPKIHEILQTAVETDERNKLETADCVIGKAKNM